jgi:hypothetical protein
VGEFVPGGFDELNISTLCCDSPKERGLFSEGSDLYLFSNLFSFLLSFLQSSSKHSRPSREREGRRIIRIFPPFLSGLSLKEGEGQMFKDGKQSRRYVRKMIDSIASTLPPRNPPPSPPPVSVF